MARFWGDWQQRPPEAPLVACPSCGVLELPDEGVALTSGASERLPTPLGVSGAAAPE